MKKLGYLIAAVVIPAIFAPAVSAQQSTSYIQRSDNTTGGVAGIVKADIRPSTSQSLGPAHRIQVYTGNQPLTQLTIQPLYNVRVDENNIQVIEDESNGKLDATVTVDEQNKVTIAFAQPVPPEKVLEIRMFGLTPPNQFFPKSLAYSVNGSYEGMSQTMPFGVVQVRTYGPR